MLNYKPETQTLEWWTEAASKMRNRIDDSYDQLERLHRILNHDIANMSLTDEESMMDRKKIQNEIKYYKQRIEDLKKHIQHILKKLAPYPTQTRAYVVGLQPKKHIKQ